MNTRSTLVEKHRSVRIALTSVGALLLAGATACGSPAGDDPTPSAPVDQPARSTPSPEAAARSTPVSTETTAAAATSGPDRTPAAFDDALIEQAREQGTVSVIVTLDIPYRPEAELAGPAEVEAQRTAIAAAQDELAASVPNATVTTRMTLFPQIVLTVDEEALRQLATSPLVRSVDENTLDAPTS